MTEKKNIKCIECATTVTWVSLVDSAILALFKGVVGLLTGSRALTASALYSVHDVISGVVVLIGLKVGTKPADDDHPYGHGNVEYLVSAFTSILILAAAIYLLSDSCVAFFKGEDSVPHWAALVAAVISVFANEITYQFEMCAYRHTNSPALFSHAKHHRADVISSLMVAFAIAGGMLGYRFLDAIVAIFEAGHLIVVSAELLYHGGSGLVDRAIGTSGLALIRQSLSSLPEVKDVKDIKTRQIGRSVWIDLYVSLPDDRTVAEAGAISDKIRLEIKNNLQHVGNINVMYV